MYDISGLYFSPWWPHLSSCLGYVINLLVGFEPPKLECQSELGMKNGKIPDSAITATTMLNQYYGPDRARLGQLREGSYAGAWIPKTQDIGQWIEVDLSKITKITRLATQGRQEAAHYTKSYTLSYSVEGGPFLPWNDGQVNRSLHYISGFGPPVWPCLSLTHL